MSEKPLGPVITAELFAYRTDGLVREVERRMESEASKAAHSLSAWTTEHIRDAYMRGLADGFAQGVLSATTQPDPNQQADQGGK